MKDSLLAIEKPCRYLGGETGSAPAVPGEVRFVLAFPDTYEVGMSHLGLQILYGVLKGTEGVFPERVYAPWPDREAALRGSGAPLVTLESGTPLAQVDIVGFTLQYELSYTNILNMLELGGIPFHAAERSLHDPLVIGGGPCACNPEPLAEFFDLFFLGDAEEGVAEIASAFGKWKGSGESRKELLRRLARIQGVYVPSLFDIGYDESGRISSITPLEPGYEKVTRRILPQLEDAPYPTSPVVPLMKTVHDRVSVEVARGCTRGCRFCQAGYLYRPVRERSPQRVLQIVQETLANTGYDEISLLSLSTGDYGCILPLLQELMERYRREQVAVSLPSLRVGTLSREMVEEVRKVRKTGFTLAPEAGSERMRQAINKGITEEDLLENAREAFAAGWRLIKLYFMMGLPGETAEDLLAIADLSRRVKFEGKRSGGGEVNVSVSTFVPKAHTPFQWEPQISLQETRTRHVLLREELRRRKLPFKWHDPPLSFLEGVFARGDRRLGKALLLAQQKGCRFDGWGEKLRFDLWEEAFRDAGIDPLFYLRGRNAEEILPWDHLQCGADKSFLLREREKAASLEYTPDCRTGSCSGCGVCDFREILPRTSSGFSPTPRRGEPELAAPPAARLRIRFEKRGRMSFVSHLELITLFTRAVRRAGIPIRYSHGFHPHPKFSFATALSVGVESGAEYLDMEVDAGCTAEEALEGLNRVLPEGMRVLEAAEVPLKGASLSVVIEAVRYRVTLPEGAAEGLPEMMTRFLAMESFPLAREKKGKLTEIDLRGELLEMKAEGNVLEMVVRRGKPLEFAAAVTGRTAAGLQGAGVHKLDVIFAESARQESE